MGASTGSTRHAEQLAQGSRALVAKIWDTDDLLWRAHSLETYQRADEIAR